MATVASRGSAASVPDAPQPDRDDPTYDPWADRRNWRGPGMIYRCREDPRVIVPKLDQSGWTVNMAWPVRAIGLQAAVLVLLLAPIAILVIPRHAGPLALYHYLMLTLGGTFLLAGLVALLDR